MVPFSVGIGSDFDGIGEVPVGLEDVSKYPALVSIKNNSSGINTPTNHAYLGRLLNSIVVDGLNMSLLASQAPICFA